MNGIMKKKSKDEILNLFGYRCIVCGRKTTTLHEIEPKSKRPKDWDDPENQVPICVVCHDKIHREGALNWKDKLIDLRKKRIANTNRGRFTN